MSTIDLTYQLRAGQLMIDTGAVVRTDSFTFSVFGQPWLNQQWLAQIVLAAVHGVAGWAGLALLRSLLVGVVVAGILAGCRLVGLGPRASAVLALLAFVVAAPAMGLRPQLFGMACFAIVLALLAARRRQPRLIWLIPLVTLAWANLHGSFPLAVAAVGIALLDDLVERRSGPSLGGGSVAASGSVAATGSLAPSVGSLVAVLVATAVATCLTPWGPGVWGYAVELARDPRLRSLVTEWQPPSPLSFVGIALGLTLVGVIAAIAWSARQGVPLRRRWPTIVWLAGLAFLALTAERGIAWWAVGAPVAVAGLLAEALSRRPVVPARPDPPGIRAVGTAIVGGVIGLGVVLVVPWIGADPVLGPSGRLTDAPRSISAAVLAEAKDGDHLFAAQRWGSWLEWSTPLTPVFVDSRVELFPDSVWADQLDVSSAASGWQAILDRWGVTIVAAARVEQAGLISAITTDPGWRVVLDDPDGVVLVRALSSASRVTQP